MVGVRNYFVQHRLIFTPAFHPRFYVDIKVAVTKQDRAREPTADGADQVGPRHGLALVVAARVHKSIMQHIAKERGNVRMRMGEQAAARCVKQGWTAFLVAQDTGRDRDTSRGKREFGIRIGSACSTSVFQTRSRRGYNRSER